MSQFGNGHMAPGSDLEAQVSPEDVGAVLAKALLLSSDAVEELERAKAVRAEAEKARTRAEAEALEAVEELRTRLVAEAERQLGEARELNAKAQQARSEAERQLEEAKTTRAEAESYREQVQQEAEVEAQRILDEARSAAQDEAVELRRQVSQEITLMIRDVETLRAAAQEELEAQRILTSAARIRALSPGLREQARSESRQPEEAVVEEPPVTEDRSAPRPKARKGRKPATA